MAFTIGDLGRATQTKVETIRYYERIGLLPMPPRTIANYRDYGQQELGRLSFIRRARDLGFSLDQVRALLSISGDRSCDCAGIDQIARTHLEDGFIKAAMTGQQVSNQQVSKEKLSTNPLETDRP